MSTRARDVVLVHGFGSRLCRLKMIAICATVVFLVAVGIAARGARRELKDNGKRTWTTFIASFVAYVSLGISVFLSSLNSELPIPTPQWSAICLGIPLIVAGCILYLSGRLRFGSFGLTWGLKTDRLVTSGAYQVSRNPQSVGWFLLLAGVALLGRSGGALFLSILYLLSCFVWIPIEEQILTRRFGDEYLKYQSQVPRFLGFSLRRGSGKPF